MTDRQTILAQAAGHALQDAHDDAISVAWQIEDALNAYNVETDAVKRVLGPLGALDDIRAHLSTLTDTVTTATMLLLRARDSK